MAADIRYAVRVLARSPLFAITSVVSLAIGIAASTAIFSLADALLLRPRVGVADPATVVEIGRTVGGEGFDNFGYPLFTVLRERNHTLQSIAAVRFDTGDVMSLGTSSGSERVFAGLVSGNYFEVLGTRPAIGRFFLAEEDHEPGAHPVIVLSHEFWVDHFQASREVVGTSVRLNGLQYTIVGVAEKGFTGASITSADFWVPFAMEANVRGEPNQSLLDDPNAVWHMAIGRLKPGVTVEQAQQELDAIARNYLRDRGDERANRWGIVVALSSRLPVPARAPIIGFLAVLGVLTGLVLLIACSNVAAMMLARALQRRREVATRLAVGASRRRILMELLIEGLVLAFAAGAASLPATYMLVGLLRELQPNIPIPLALELHIDSRVMAYAMGLAMLTAVLFALVPAQQVTRFDVASALHGSTTTFDRRRAWLRHGLVAGQVAMALLLLIATGLFLRSLQQAGSIDPGFNVRNVDTLQIDMRLGGYRGGRAIGALNELIDRFNRIESVTAVGASRMVPLQGGGLELGRLRAPGYQGPSGSDEVDANWDVVSNDYFRALELPIVHGRGFTDADRETAPLVAIVNETLAARVWPGRDPIGQRMLQAGGLNDEERELLIVGVAKDSKYRSLGESPRNFVYVPESQQFMPDVTFYLRRRSGESRLPTARQIVLGFDPDLPVIHADSLEEATIIGLLPQRLAAWVAGSVGTVGLLLAALGLYGLTAFAVAQRTREIAVRVALGATRESVVSLVVRQAGRLAAMGAAIGLLLSLALSQVLQSLLIGVGPLDPAFGMATLILGGVLLAASWAPARRAAQMDPMRALRAE